MSAKDSSASSSAIGVACSARSSSIDGDEHVILGVMARTFQLPSSGTAVEAAVGLAVVAGTISIRDGDQFEVIGRLAPGVRFEAATAEMQVIAARLRRRMRSIRTSPSKSCRSSITCRRATRRGMWLAFAAVISLLGIACANVGGLLSARAVPGAGSWRYGRRSAPAARGSSGSFWRRASVSGRSRALWVCYARVHLDSVATDVRPAGAAAHGRSEPRHGAAVAVAFLGGLVVVFACGTVPALGGRQDGRGRRIPQPRNQSSLPRHRLQDFLVVAQVAGALMLVVGAVLFAQSFLRARSEDPGYPAENLIIVPLDLPSERYPGRPAVFAFFREAGERIGRLPGVCGGGRHHGFLHRGATPISGSLSRDGPRAATRARLSSRSKA